MRPIADRPDMPDYGLAPATEGAGLLAWEWAQQRLRDAHNYWLSTVRPNGRPHAMAVWAVLEPDGLVFSTARSSRKARNLTRNPACVMTTESGAEAVIVEGHAFELPLPRRATARELYEKKYGEGWPDDSAVWQVRPRVVFGFIEAGAAFCGTATRWTFPVS
jgi:nitroimidazol reductase NimA-like FMN-containing flavoprotein (pyridoxamine 5'-phosphate oxidase superfamily)